MILHEYLRYEVHVLFEDAILYFYVPSKVLDIEHRTFMNEPLVGNHCVVHGQETSDFLASINS